MGNPVKWFEVTGKDAATLQSFYSKVFGWSFQVEPGMLAYGVANTGSDQGIPGGIGPAWPDQKPWVTFYVAAPDITAKLAEITAAGGSVVFPRTELPGVTLAMFADPEGQVIGLVEEAIA
jgi:hypothetical protein